jgi:hypothetical protein
MGGPNRFVSKIYQLSAAITNQLNMYYHYFMIITVLLNEDHHCILHQATSKHKYQPTRWLYIYTQAIS